MGERCKDVVRGWTKWKLLVSAHVCRW